MCIYWFASDPSPEPVIVFIAGFSAFFRDDIRGVIGSSFISLVPRAKLVRDFEHYKYSFTADNYINPAILEDLNGWVSDLGDQVVSISITDSNESNRYFGDISVTEQSGSNPIVDFVDNEKKLSYQYIGCSYSGVHILKLINNYGGSGWFGSLLLVTVSADTSVEFEQSLPIKKDRLVIKKVGSIPLGDRYNGQISYKFGFINISDCSGMRAIRTKRERVFIL
jgi:hypothetical protein